jgi:hypothetical protein
MPWTLNWQWLLGSTCNIVWSYQTSDTLPLREAQKRLLVREQNKGPPNV